MIEKVVGKSWRTSTSGTLALVLVVITAVKLGLDGKLAEINFVQVMEALIGLAISFGLIAARDNKVSSEQAGAK